MLYVCIVPQHLAPGDVIVFARPVGSGYVTHRIIAVTPAGVITRGDNNARTDDGRVAFDHVIGRVEMLEDRGRIRSVQGGRRGLW
ncbi:partial signal peptidase I, partial [Anaerolineae bacterium]